jgi:hypothetical protein
MPASYLDTSPDSPPAVTNLGSGPEAAWVEASPLDPDISLLLVGQEGAVGESKVPIYAFVDESGNTGKNIFDKAQPDYYTAALVTKGDFDLHYGSRVTAIAATVGATAIPANQLGIRRLETIAGDLFDLLDRAGAHFFVSRVQKTYLLASKMFDVLFDSGENAAVAWHVYNMKPLKIMLAFKLGYIIDDEIARAFWACLLMPTEQEARAALPSICEALNARLHLLPDQGSRKVLAEGLDWVIAHPECVQFATEHKLAKQGHFPNLVAFANLLQGLQEFSTRWRKRVACITHDEQNEFGRSLGSWHGLFSNASGDVIEWVGERYSLQWTPGSRFVMKPDVESAGIQMADVALWLYGQFLKGKELPAGCGRLLALILDRGWHNDFSFAGVEAAMMEQWGEVFFGPMEPEKLEAAAKLLEQAEQRRVASMAQYEADGLPPFARPRPIVESPALPA